MCFHFSLCLHFYCGSPLFFFCFLTSYLHFHVLFSSFPWSSHTSFVLLLPLFLLLVSLCYSLPLHSLLKMLSQNFFHCFPSLMTSFFLVIPIHLSVCPVVLLCGPKSWDITFQTPLLSPLFLLFSMLTVGHPSSVLSSTHWISSIIKLNVSDIWIVSYPGATFCVTSARWKWEQAVVAARTGSKEPVSFLYISVQILHKLFTAFIQFISGITQFEEMGFSSDRFGI